MPILEFFCNECRKRFEDLIRNNDEREALVCPQCKSGDLSRLCSTFGFFRNGKFSCNIGSSCAGCSVTSCAGCYQAKEVK